MATTAHPSGPVDGNQRWTDRGDIPPHPANVHEARHALDQVSELLLADGDARAAFADVYAIITRRVAEKVDSSERVLRARRADGAEEPFFYEPRWVSRLAGHFCERYMETLRWSLFGGHQDAGAWDATYEAIGHQGTLPLQHVLLGLSAHINSDLAIGIYRTILELGPTDAATLRRYRHDHDAVNDLLRASVPEAFDHLIRRHHCEASMIIFQRSYTLAEWAAMLVLTRWRARVWDDAIAMLLARGDRARQAIVRRMERVSRRYARLLSIPGRIPLVLHVAAV